MHNMASLGLIRFVGRLSLRFIKQLNLLPDEAGQQILARSASPPGQPTVMSSAGKPLNSEP
jgi:hypothetical protein